MRRILDRYVLTECLPTLGISVAVLTFVLMMHRLVLLSDLVAAKGVPVGEVLRLLVLAIPTLLPLLLPVSLLFAVLIAAGRLSADSEIVAMRACGLGLGQNLRPILGLSATVAMLAAAVSLWVHPVAARSFKQAFYDSVKNRMSVATQAGVFSRIARGITVYAKSVDPRSGTMNDLFLHLNRKGSEGVWILAPSGALSLRDGALNLNLRNGEMHQFRGSATPYRRLRFQSCSVGIPLPASGGQIRVEDRPTRVLLDRVRSPTRDREARLEFHRRLALPASCLVFGILGLALGLHHTKSGWSRGVGLCVAVLLIFYALLMAGKAMGEKAMIAPELAMWMPNMALGGLAAYAYARKTREAPLPLEEAIGRFFKRIRPRSAAQESAS